MTHYCKFTLSEKTTQLRDSRAEAKGMAEKMLNHSKTDSGKAPSYSHILEVLLRLRQVCAHWKLTGERVTNLLKLLEKDEVVVLNKQNKEALQLLLQLSIDSQEECSVCLEYVLYFTALYLYHASYHSIINFEA